MTKEKTPYNSPAGDYSDKKSDDINSSAEKASYIQQLKQVYLPDSKANYSPSEDSIEQANDLNSTNHNLVAEAIATKK